MLQELTVEQRERLREWWKPELYQPMVNIYGIDFYLTSLDGGYLAELNKCFPLLSIGQCIQLLVGKNMFKGFHKSQTDGRFKIYGENCDKHMVIYDSLELIHALWQAVKAVL